MIWEPSCSLNHTFNTQIQKNPKGSDPILKYKSNKIDQVMSTMMEQVLSDNVIFLRREKDLHLGKPGQGNDQTRPKG